MIMGIKNSFEKKLLALVAIFSIIISGTACRGKQKGTPEERIIGKYGYQGAYLDLPEKDGYSLYDLGDIFFSDGEYCLSAVYVHSDEKTGNQEFVTDILSVGQNGQISYVLEITKLQMVQAVFEQEYAFLAYSDQDLLAVQEGKMNEADICTDLVFFDKKTGDTTRVIQPKMHAKEVFSVSDGIVLVGSQNIAKYSYEGALQSEIQISLVPQETRVFEDSGNTYLVTGDEWESSYYKLDFSTNRAEFIISSQNLGNDAEYCFGKYLFGLEGEYKVNLGTLQVETLARWNEVDIRPEKQSGTHQEYVGVDDTKFAIKRLYPDGTGDVGFFTYDNTVNQNRTEIVVGGYGVYTDEMLKWAVYTFNTNNDQYRVVLEDYADKFSYSSPQEAQMARLKMLKYFNEGHSPDIFYGDWFDYQYLGEAGMVMDLAPFFNSDPVIGLDSFLPSIQNILLQDGEHCYSVFSSFTTGGYWGLKREFPVNQVSLADIRNRCVESKKRFTSDQSAPSIAGEALLYNFARLWGAYGTEKIISRQDLEELLECTIELGIDPEVSWGSIASTEQVYNGQYYLASSGPVDVYSFSIEEKKAKESIVFVGYPSFNSSVHLVLPRSLVGISSSTRYPEECWSFIRELILPGIQKKVPQSGQIPVNRDAFELMLQSVMDPNGVEDGDMRVFVSGKEKLKADVIEDYREFIDSLDTIRTIDWGAYNIICEEVTSYYTQGRSVKQIAETLDDRLSLYVEENY